MAFFESSEKSIGARILPNRIAEPWRDLETSITAGNEPAPEPFASSFFMGCSPSGINEFAFAFAHNEHRTRRVPNDSFRGAAQQGALKAGIAASSNDNQVGL